MASYDGVHITTRHNCNSLCTEGFHFETMTAEREVNREHLADLIREGWGVLDLNLIPLGPGENDARQRFLLWWRE
jgi:hypothetical protein